MKRNIGFVFIIFLLLLLFSGCPLKKVNEIIRPEYYQAINYRIDSLNARIQNYYITNPDSAEVLLLLTLKEIDTFDYPERKFYLLLGLAEYYQNYKPDNIKAIDFAAQAIGIYLKNPEKFLLNSYTFIDMGNLFYNLHYYSHAISFYRIAMGIDHQNEKSHGRLVALMNTGLAFQHTKDSDSAMDYFRRVNRLVYGDNNILNAQNYSYMADLFLEKGNGDSVKKLSEKTIAILDQYCQHEQKDKNWNIGPVYRDWQFVRAKSHAILSDYYYRIGEFRKSEENFNLGMKHAELSKNRVAKIRLIENHALHDKLFPDTDSLITNADWAMKYLQDSKNPENKQLFADSLSAMFLRLGLVRYANRYARVSRQIKDSLLIFKASSERIQELLLIAFAATEQSKQTMKFQVLEDLIKIQYQRKIILVVVVLCFLISIVLVIILMQYQRIKQAHRILVERIQDNLRLKENKIIFRTLPADIENRLEEQLNQLMQTQKPFLQKDITLHEMANILGSNKTYLSAYLNHHKNITFNDLLNRYRVEELCGLLAQTTNDRFTLEYLAEQCGFNSKSTFYTVFKRFTGMSPATYRNHIRKLNR